MLVECPNCKWKYPDNILNVLRVTGTKGALNISVCGLCALEITNEVHGIKRERLNGEIAEHMRLLAKQWRKTHPNMKSKEK